MEAKQNVQSLGEEVANSVLHGAGFLLTMAGLAVMVLRKGSSLPVIIFAGAMLLMFLASTVYHALGSWKLKNLFRMFDHQAIYIFIAGTYTPYCLLALKGALGWIFFGFEWALALTGIVLSALGCRFLKKAEVTIFILMGWAILGGCVPLARALSLKSLLLLFGGGLAYTAGTFWYRAGKDGRRPKKNGREGNRSLPAAGVPGAHVVWHLFVLAGAACHWFSVWFLCFTI
ncbi:MAG: hemolysin III family protein [Treponema sp.]|jgi:hemolysin III|nr:hemolysin III family protein [Treponema sp.]